MGKKLSIEEFVNKSKIIHNNEYDYDLVNYINNSTKVKIICKKHGEFLQTPRSHLSKHGCPLCYGTPRKNEEKFINDCIQIHDNKYDYSLVKYKNSHSKIKIICTTHGVFEQVSRSHLRGNGCPYCVGLGKYNNKSFIEKSKTIHGNKYDYSLIEYVDSKTKIKIICKIHGIFEQVSSEHLIGSGCPSCSKKFRYDNKSFIEKSKEVHGDIFNYDLTEYENNKTKVKISCKKHGVFEVRPDNHINSKNGCPVCCESIGEKHISIFLNDKNIEFKREKKFKTCKNINLLSFDFYLPEFNICIEYDGKQHYEPIEYFGGPNSLKSQNIKDEIKNKFCQENGIRLIRIRYDENINEKLSFLK